MAWSDDITEGELATPEELAARGAPQPARYDSRPDTWEHISQVQGLLMLMQHDLAMRALTHDWSKLYPPEVAVFDEYTPKLEANPFGTPGYAENLRGMKPALDHHYAVHDHHPEHFGEPTADLHGTREVTYTGGVFDMAAPQIIEMCADWIASSRRTEGERPPAYPARIIDRLPALAERFGYAGTALERTIEQTVNYLLAAERAGQPPDA